MNISIYIDKGLIIFLMVLIIVDCFNGVVISSKAYYAPIMIIGSIRVLTLSSVVLIDLIKRTYDEAKNTFKPKKEQNQDFNNS